MVQRNLSCTWDCMKSDHSAREFFPAKMNLTAMRSAASHCKGCDLWKHATQTVFGEGKTTAKVVLVGEQPGNEEDIVGKPFVGPAGRLLDRALAEAGVSRSQCYVTNVVKHFKWEPRGKRRIHKKPGAREVAACRPWLDAEIAVIKPDVLVILGATAAQAIMGPSFRVTEQRGKVVASDVSASVVATVHPSSILRAIDDEARRREYELFVKDLKVVARIIHSLSVRTGT